MQRPRPIAIITQDALSAVYAHALQEYPLECCGIVFGPGDRSIADQVRTCCNIQDILHSEDPVKYRRTARTAYQFHNENVMALLASFNGDCPGKIIYHSHVDKSAKFSAGDQHYAKIGERPAYPVDYVVVEIETAGICGAVQFGWSKRQRRYVEICRYSPDGDGVSELTQRWSRGVHLDAPFKGPKKLTEY